MAGKKKCPPAGAPEWVMTYGDMMSLLLTFFIMLVAISEVKKEDQYRVIVDAVKKHFGTMGGGAMSPSDGDPKNSVIKEILDKTLMGPKPKQSNADDPGVIGKEETVKDIRPANHFQIGAPITFDPGSAQLSEKARRDLLKIAQEIKGLNNIVKLVGHAAPADVTGDSIYNSLDELCFHRTIAVRDFLVSDEVGIRPDRLRLIQAGEYEPLEFRVYDETAQEPNRRVEVIMTDLLVREIQGAGLTMVENR